MRRATRTAPIYKISERNLEKTTEEHTAKIKRRFNVKETEVGVLLWEFRSSV